MISVVGVGGSPRPGSASTMALRSALSAAEAQGARVRLIGARQLLEMPLYAPDETVRTAATVGFVEAVARADGLIVCSPGYHGGISALVKNALDYIEDLRHAEHPYLEGKAVGCIACSSGPQAAVTTLDALRSVVHALRAWPTPAGVAIGSAGSAFDEEGRALEPRVAEQLELVGAQVVEFAQVWRPGSS